ncbi:hypothetical protein MHBO_002379 [Bonamia ostreae]|uniref:PDK1-type PH domain-containing protein n=1 Tax=Bonamia ostreae TaxID=126728 RepID=A0ABV2AMX6_9EUKA
MKGAIDIMCAFNIEESNNNFFVIRVPGRDYKFKSVDESSRDWVKILNKTIIDTFHKNKFK